MIDLKFVEPTLRRLDELSAEVVACGIWKDVRPVTGIAALLDWRLAGRLSKLAKETFLAGEVGEVLVVPARPRLPFDKLLVAGLGPRSSFGDATFRRVLERIFDSLAGLSVKRAVIELPGRGDAAIEPEPAADILLDLLGDDEKDALTFAEIADGQKRIEKRAHERHLSVLRAREGAAVR